MKTITCFIATLTCGGAEHQMVILIEMLLKKGYKIRLLNRGNTEDHYALPKGVEREWIKNRRNILARFWEHFKFFIREKTDVVICFEQRENMFMLPAMFFRPKIKVIASERNLTYGKQNWKEKLLLKILYKRADYVVPNSVSQREHLLKYRPEWDKKIITINNYTDLSHYSYTPLPQNHRLRIGVFCRYAEQKNYKRFVECITKLKMIHGDKFVVEWYGKQNDGEVFNEDYLKMRELVTKHNIQDCLILNNRINNVESVLPSFDAISVPSIYEGFSNSIAESICCGRPVLAGNVSDNPIMIQDGINGFLFDPLNVDDMVDAFNKYLSLSKEERNNLSIAARKRAEELFDSENFIQKYITLIES